MPVDVIREQAEKIKQNSSLYRAFLILQEKSPLTIAHCVNTSLICYHIGEQMGLGKQDLQQVVYAALVHDIGKSKIDEHILTAERDLTEDEYDIVKQHVELGNRLLKGIPRRIRRAVVEHHENADGSGYPHQKSGRGISLLGKILHVADVADAICSRREYKKPCKQQEACEYLQEESGRLFDEKVVKAYISYIQEGKKEEQII